jgi:DNA-binding transcriptional LysR family regulator
MRRDHRFAKRSSVSWDDIAGERFISVWKGAAIRILLDFELAKANKSIAFFYEVRNMDAALRFVEAGLGVAAVTRMVIPRRERSNLVGVPLVEPSLSRNLGLIRLSSKIMRPRARDFWNMLHEHWRAIAETDWSKLGAVAPLRNHEARHCHP